MALVQLCSVFLCWVEFFVLGWVELLQKYNFTVWSHLTSLVLYCKNSTKLSRIMHCIMFTTFHVSNISCLQHFTFAIFHVYNIARLQHFMFTKFHLYNISRLQHFTFTIFHVYNISCLQHFMFTLNWTKTGVGSSHVQAYYMLCCSPA